MCARPQYALRVRVYANCRVRRIFFSDRLYKDWELPLCLRVKADNRSDVSQQPQSSQHGPTDATAAAKEEESKEQTALPAVRVAEVMVL